MQAIRDLLSKVEDQGFKGVYPLYISYNGAWSNEYALFELEFEENDDDLALEFCNYIEEMVPGVEINLKDYEYEVIGDFDDDDYWDFPLIDSI